MRTVDSDRLCAGAVAAGGVGGLLSGATRDHGDADDDHNRVLPARHAFEVWAPTYAGSRAYAAEARRRVLCVRRAAAGAAAATPMAAAGRRGSSPGGSAS